MSYSQISLPLRAVALGMVATFLTISNPSTAVGATPVTPSTRDSFLVVDTFTLDDGRKVETVELPGLRCFQPNVQFAGIDAHDERFVNGEWGNHEFVFALPKDYSGGSFPVFLNLRGGGFGWVDTTVPLDQVTPDLYGVSWGQVRGPGVHFNFGLLSTQWWTRKHAYTSFTHEPLEEVPGAAGSPSRFLSQLRDRFPAWGILFPSYCSRDAYYGRGERGMDGVRYGYEAVIRALDYVEHHHGIDVLVVGGTSAGGLGAGVIARDLQKDRPDIDLLGAIVDSGPAEVAAYGRVKDEGVVGGLRRVQVGEDKQTWVQCDHPLQNTTRGLDTINFLDFSLSEAIEDGTITTPIFHAWNSRDSVISCGDLAFGQEHLEGAIARAIEEHNPGGASVNYEKCGGTTRACTAEAPTPIGECPDSQVVEIPCSGHGVLSGGPNVADALDWMEKLLEQKSAE